LIKDNKTFEGYHLDFKFLTF